MRKARVVGMLGLLMLASVGALAGPEARSGNVDTRGMVAGNTAFALDLYAQLKDRDGNLFFSPYSISSALAMTYAGARGETAAQMRAALHLPGEDASTHAAFAALAKHLASAEGSGCTLHVANALWGQEGYTFLEEFLQTVETHYGANLNSVDFARAAEKARITINRWVEQQTKGKITDLLKPGVVDALTRLVLTNAIYFKGRWASPFEPQRTHEAPFYVSPLETAQTSFMHQEKRFAYAETEAVQAVEMPYQGDALSMVVVLPRDKGGLRRIEGSLTPAGVEAWLKNLRPQQVEVFLPKFKTTSAFSLARILSGLGMPLAFAPGHADFSGMTGNRDLFISAVVHKAFVDVNEEGTEAAAATGVAMALAGAPPPAAPVFRADHPFLFLIRHRPTGNILFLGRFATPA